MKLENIDPEELQQHWWMLLLRGIAALLFGLLTLFAPGVSLAALVLGWGIYAFADGAFLLVSALRGKGKGDFWWLLALQGVLGVAAGVVTFLWPGITAIALLYLIAGWSLAMGVLEVVEAIRLRKTHSGEWMLALRGVAAIAFGVLLAAVPGIGALVLVLWIGAFSVIVGPVLIALALRLHSGRPSRPEPHLAHG